MKDTWLYRRGDIYLVDLGKHFGSEQGGCRPVLLIQNNIGNYYGPTLIVAPITSRFLKKAKQPTHFALVGVDNLISPSVVLTEQILTIDKSRVIKYVGKVVSASEGEVEVQQVGSLTVKRLKKTWTNAMGIKLIAK